MRPGVAAGADGVYAVWSTPTGIQALVPGKPQPVDLAPKGSFPAIAAAAQGALAAWEDDGKITIQQIP